MKIFKFGGASVKDADGVRNLLRILKMYQNEPLIVVISAMGKTTNSLEKLIKHYFENDKKKALEALQEVKTFHEQITKELANDSFKYLYTEIDNILVELESMLDRKPDGGYDYVYDQLICYGEIISTRIVSAYLLQEGLNNRWIDARNFIFTDDSYRRGRVNWELTEDMISRRLKPIAEKHLVITQGFIGKNNHHANVTLGREGSDYTAAIMAWCTNASDVTIWKDVAGVMNGDPKRLKDAIKIDDLTYNVAIELAYYGATIIHPKTIQPLKNKKIPLYVKSFINPEESGTVIKEGAEKKNEIPYYIFKKEQALMSISSKDFSFIVEDNLSHIFNEISKCGVTINVMQNSAISFMLCINNEVDKIKALTTLLKKDYDIKIQKDVELISIRNYNQESIDKMLINRKVLMEQKSAKVIQFVLL